MGWEGRPITSSTFWRVMRRVSRVVRLSEGDLTMKLVTNAKDTSSLLFAMQNMITKLSQVVSDVNGGAQALASASEEVSATAQALSQAASEQAAATGERVLELRVACVVAKRRRVIAVRL